jgi:hypothetical protein
MPRAYRLVVRREQCGAVGRAALMTALGHFPALPHCNSNGRFTSKSSRNSDKAALALWPSRPGEFHPEPLTDPDLTLSRHPARATARRLPPSIEYRVPPVAG